jgi:hypothetical protein
MPKNHIIRRGSHYHLHVFPKPVIWQNLKTSNLKPAGSSPLPGNSEPGNSRSGMLDPHLIDISLLYTSVPALPSGLYF